MQGQFCLSPCFCVRNGIAVVKQSGAEISFVMENFEDDTLKENVRESFRNYLRKAGAGAPGGERSMRVTFSRGTHDEVAGRVSEFCATAFGGARAEGKACGTGCGAAVFCGVPTRDPGDTAPCVLLDKIIADARKRRAADVHVERRAVRFRVNGLLVHSMDLREEISCALVRRIKFLARMDAAEKQEMHYGHFVYGGGHVFVRVSCACGGPEARGQTAVLRLLDLQRLPLAVESLGMGEGQLAALRGLCSQENGLVLVCGAAASGKSTTAAAMLLEARRLSGGAKKIVSVADPHECALPEVTQIGAGRGQCFADSFPRIFRHDPDVIFMGEIDGRIGAEAAVAAALSGCLVFATLRAPGEAAAAVFRMLGFGVDRDALVSVLRGVVSQQLMYGNGFPELVADVARARDDLKYIATGSATSEEIENGFLHCTNALSYVMNAVRRLPQPSWKKSVRVPHEKRREEVRGGA